ncbi:hypothetical protein GBA52_012370 [Prunus armeniaca]|nr:hypothetical protein GBA52_012370 [Prunus armeniaca]
MGQKKREVEDVPTRQFPMLQHAHVNMRTQHNPDTTHAQPPTAAVNSICMHASLDVPIEPLTCQTKPRNDVLQ